jgi:hypothetical protein
LPRRPPSRGFRCGGVGRGRGRRRRRWPAPPRRVLPGSAVQVERAREGRQAPGMSPTHARVGGTVIGPRRIPAARTPRSRRRPRRDRPRCGEARGATAEDDAGHRTRWRPDDAASAQLPARRRAAERPSAETHAAAQRAWRRPRPHAPSAGNRGPGSRPRGRHEGAVHALMRSVGRRSGQIGRCSPAQYTPVGEAEGGAVTSRS